MAVEYAVRAHHKTHEVVKRLLSGMEKGRLLDVAAGDGPLSAAAREMGHDVTACDLFPENFKAPGVECLRVDLDEGFPFDDGSFDCVIAVEIIEHLHDRFRFLRDSGRILKPGGTMVLTTPNVLNLAARSRYLFSGFWPLFARPLNEFDPNSVHRHVSPLPYQFLHHALAMTGFRITNVTTDRWRRSALLLAGLYPLVRIASRSALRKEKHPEMRKVTKRILKAMRSASILFGRTTIIVAEKV